MFKLSALLFIFTSCAIVGFYQASRLSRRKILLIQYRDLLQRLETEMGYFKEPLPRILEKLHSGTNEPVDLLLRQCMLEIENGTEGLEKIWTCAVRSAYEQEPLKTADYTVLNKCGSFIGQSDYQRQKGHFSLVKEEISRQINNAEEDCRTKGPLYSRAGLSVGAIVIIALL